MLNKILIVDDEKANRYLIKKILKEYEILSADNGPQMWSILGNNTPDLILLDIMIPEEDGFSLKKKLNADPVYRDIPVIFVTAKTHSNDIAGGFECGAFDYITKPIDDTVLLARVRNVLKIRTKELKIKEESLVDSLTGLYNRRKLSDDLNGRINLYKREKRLFSLTIIDIDYFKKINDKYGHQAGDYILVQFSGLLKKNARPYDCVARYGGEEFAIIFEDITKSETCTILHRFAENIARTDFNFEGNLIKFTFSAGVTDASDPDMTLLDAEILLGIADKRLYKAKELGRNKIISEDQ